MRGDQSFDVFGEHVHLDVHSITASSLTECGDFGGVWNDGHAERIAIDVERREAYAIHGDGALLHEQVGEVSRYSNAQVRCR